MKRILLALLIALCPIVADAVPYYEGTLQDTSGNALSGASVYVYRANTTTEVTLYSDREATTTTDNPVTTSAYGRFNFYVRNGDYDLYVTGTGITAYTLEDVQIYDLVTPGSWFIDVTSLGAVPDDGLSDRSAFVAAIDSAAAGGGAEIRVPAGVFNLDSLVVDEDVSIIGAGQVATVLEFSTTTAHCLDWSGAGVAGWPDYAENKPGSVLRDLQIRYTGAGQASGKHILNVSRKIYASRVIVKGDSLSGDGIHLESGDQDNETPYFAKFEACRSDSAGGHGLHITDNCNANIFIDCQFIRSWGDGVHQETVGGTIAHNNIFIGGQASYNKDDGYNFVNGTHVNLIGCYAENNDSTGLKTTASVTKSMFFMGSTTGNGTNIDAADVNGTIVSTGGELAKPFSTVLQRLSFGNAAGPVEYEIYPAGTPDDYDDGTGDDVLIFRGTGTADEFRFNTSATGTMLKLNGSGVQTFYNLSTSLDSLKFGDDGTAAFSVSPAAADSVSDQYDNQSGHRTLKFGNTGSSYNGWDFVGAGGDTAALLRPDYLRIPLLAAQPDSSVEGGLYYNAADSTVYVRGPNTWIALN